MKPKQLDNKTGKQLKSVSSDVSEVLPVVDFVQDHLQKTNTNRRDFLKAMGFSVSAAALAASCEIPTKYAAPYVNKPEEITPGKAVYYASSFFDGASFASILVKTRDGRPIKVDGNPNSPVTKGATNAALQASVMGVYDHTRFQNPRIEDTDSTWDEVLANVKNELSAVSGEVVLLTGPVISPTVQRAIDTFTAAYNAKHIVYSPSKYDALLLANEEQFGKKAAPVLHFDQAEVIVSFGADFLGNWLGGDIQYGKDYASTRKVSADKRKMSKHYQVESFFSLTGSNADSRMTVKPSQMKETIFALHNLLAAKLGGSNISGVSSSANPFLENVVKDLLVAKGKSIVVASANDVETQKVINAINSMLENYGSTIEFNRTLNFIQGDNKEFIDFVSQLKSGNIGAVFVHGANPVYDSPLAKELKEAMKKPSVTVSFDMAPNETTETVKYILPDNHYLESWADYEPVTGSFALAQPTIKRLFDTKEFAESLLLLSDYEFEDKEKGIYGFVQEGWKSIEEGDFEAFWDESLRSGFYHKESVEAASTSSADASGISFKPTSTSDLEIVLFEDKLGSGIHATNPYMQELPDPISKVTWGNYAMVSLSYAKEQGWSIDRNVKPGKEKTPIVKITVDGKHVELPVLAMPGMPKGVAAIPVGYGRELAGLVGTGIGANAHQLATVVEDLVIDYGQATLEETGRKEELAQTQLHYTIPDDRTTVKHTTLAKYQKETKAGNEDRYTSEFRHAIGESANGGPAEGVTLYPGHKYPGHKWGMNIDLNSCYGCGACVVACNIENNIPVVGKTEVANQRDMHWLRIDRYFASEDQDPKSETYMEDASVVFMPMLCQHCDNAPCENVCPVNATNHSSEGLNQMSYNRCIGTRYCANNCPFKVRRFNWFDYWGADSFGPLNDHNHKALLGNGRKNVDPTDENGKTVSANMRHDLSRMILNPDVTVRSRGVIEKCSFCVQRIQEKKLDAKISGKPMEADAIKTACQSACPSEAIVFGDVNNKESEVAKLQQDDRNFYVLEEFHVLPSIGYLTKVSNSEKALFDKMSHSHFVAHESSHGEDSHGEENSHNKTKDSH